jgi:short-subunit dehydrogenase
MNAPRSVTGRPVALVTGASSGIGRELALLCAAGGHDLVLVARREPELAALAVEIGRGSGAHVTVIPLDLAQPAARDALLPRLEQDGIQIDVLINNAGFGVHGAFAKTDLAADRELLEVNVIALTELTKRFLKPMLARRRGRIMNVASTAAFQPGPFMAVYYASKAYVLHFTEAIAEETTGSGVTITALCPGPTTTGFQQRAALDHTKLFRPGSRLMTADARAVAEAGYRGMMAGRRLVIPGFKNQALAFANRFVPRWLAAKVVRGIQEQVGA